MVPHHPRSSTHPGTNSLLFSGNGGNGPPRQPRPSSGVQGTMLRPPNFRVPSGHAGRTRVTISLPLSSDCLTIRPDGKGSHPLPRNIPLFKRGAGSNDCLPKLTFVTRLMVSCPHLALCHQVPRFCFCFYRACDFLIIRVLTPKAFSNTKQLRRSSLSRSHPAGLVVESSGGTRGCTVQTAGSISPRYVRAGAPQRRRTKTLAML